MITTIGVKSEQLDKGSFCIGSGPEIVLIIGSCRSIPYLNYFDYLNTNNRFTIHFIDPFNWNWDIHDNRVNYEEAINALETNSSMLDLIRSARWYIHEHYQNYGMFNNDPKSPKNIYQFGMKPEVDVCIPNFHDLFIMFQNIIDFNREINELAKLEYSKVGILGYDVQLKIREIGLASVEKFCWVAQQTSFPEMAQHFRDTWKTIRYFWNFNHVTNRFTGYIMRMMNEKFLHMDLPHPFLTRIDSEDMYANPHTMLTQYDVDNYGIQWQEPVVPLKI